MQDVPPSLPLSLFLSLFLSLSFFLKHTEKHLNSLRVLLGSSILFLYSFYSTYIEDKEYNGGIQ